jgi:hypothetical protein
MLQPDLCHGRNSEKVAQEPIGNVVLREAPPRRLSTEAVTGRVRAGRSVAPTV